jgi:hypothetical protein
MAGYDGTIRFKTKIDDADIGRQLSALKAKILATTESFSGMGEQAGHALLGIAAAGAATLGPMIKLASDLNESTNAAAVVFKDSTKTITDWGKTAAQQAGLTSAEFNQMAAVMGSMLINAGASTGQAADQTIELTKRAADMASVFNTDVTDAMTAVQAALRGETEPIRRYGVSLDQTAIAAKAVSMGLATNANDVSTYAKSQAALAIVMDQTNALQGDFVNTSDQLANGTRIATATLKEQAAQAGAVLLPMVLQVVSGFNQWATEGDHLKNILSGIAKAVELGFSSGAIQTILGMLAAIKALSVASKILNTVLSANPFMKLLTAVTLVVSVSEILVKAFTDTRTASEKMMDQIDENDAKFKEILGPIDDTTKAQKLSGDQIEQLTKLYPKLTDKIDLHTASLEDALAAQKALLVEQVKEVKTLATTAVMESAGTLANRREEQRYAEKQAGDSYEMIHGKAPKDPKAYQEWAKARATWVAKDAGVIAAQQRTQEAKAAYDQAQKDLKAADDKLDELLNPKKTTTTTTTTPDPKGGDDKKADAEKKAKEKADLEKKWADQAAQDKIDAIEAEKKAALDSALEQGTAWRDLMTISEEYDAKALAAFTASVNRKRDEELAEARRVGANAATIAAINAFYDKQISDYYAAQLKERADLDKQWTDNADKAAQDKAAKEKERLDKFTSAAAAAADSFKPPKESEWESFMDALEKKLEELKKTSMDWEKILDDVGNLALESVVSGFEEIGKSIVTGTSDWSDWGASALSALADVLDSIAKQLVAMGVVHALMGDLLGAGIAAGAAIAAGVAAGAVRAWSDSLKDAQETAEEAAEEAASYAKNLTTVQTALKKTLDLLRSTTRATDLYDVELTKVIDSVNSFYESLESAGADISSTLIDSLVNGLDGDDFLFALEEYIRKAVIQAAVYTTTFQSQVAAIGQDLATAIASGANESDIEAIRNRLVALFQTAQTLANAATAVVGQAFGSYAVGSLNIQGDQLARIHNGEMILPAGISAEARAAGITISPATDSSVSMRSVVLKATIPATLNVDGKAMAYAVLTYQDELQGVSFGS